MHWRTRVILTATASNVNISVNHELVSDCLDLPLCIESQCLASTRTVQYMDWSPDTSDADAALRAQTRTLAFWKKASIVTTVLTLLLVSASLGLLVKCAHSSPYVLLPIIYNCVFLFILIGGLLCIVYNSRTGVFAFTLLYSLIAVSNCGLVAYALVYFPLLRPCSQRARCANTKRLVLVSLPYIFMCYLVGSCLVMAWYCRMFRKSKITFACFLKDWQKTHN